MVDSGGIGEQFDDDGFQDGNESEHDIGSTGGRQVEHESSVRDCGVLDGAGTSANDPRPPREDATALGIEHLDDTVFDFDDLEL